MVVEGFLIQISTVGEIWKPGFPQASISEEMSNFSQLCSVCTGYVRSLLSAHIE